MEVIIAYKQHGVIILQNGMEDSLLPRPILPIQVTITYGFGYVMRQYLLWVVKIGYGAGNLQDAVVGTGW